MAPAADVYMIIANLLLSGNVVSINPEESLAGPREQLVAQVWSSFERCRHYNLIIVYFLYNDCRILNIYIFILIRWKECSHPMRGPEKLDLQILWYNFVSSVRSSYSHPDLLVIQHPNPENGPLGPQKVKNDPKIKSNWKVRIERIIENCSTTWIHSKTVFERYTDPNDYPLDRQKVKRDPKIEQFLNLTLTPKISYLSPKKTIKTKMWVKSKSYNWRKNKT